MASDPTKVLDEIEQWVIKGDPVHKTAEDAFRHIDQCKARVMALVAIARAAVTALAAGMQHTYKCDRRGRDCICGHDALSAAVAKLRA